MNFIQKITLEIKKVWNWLFAKRSELFQMNHKDALMAHIVVDIMQNSKKHGFKYCKLHSLDPIHPVDNRKNTIRATQERVNKLKPYRNKLLKRRKLSKEDLSKYLPSATYARAIPTSEGRHFTFEGNGRIAALKQIFTPQDNIEIELDVYYPRHGRKVRRNIKKLRAMHGME